MQSAPATIARGDSEAARPHDATVKRHIRLAATSSARKESNPSMTFTSANRRGASSRNAQRSTGPKSAAGKARSSGNARRHGLGAAELGATDDSAEVKRILEALCAPGADPARIEQARIIAEASLLIRRVRAARVALVERCRKPPSTPGFNLGDKRASDRMAYVGANKLAIGAECARRSKELKESCAPCERDDQSAFLAGLPELMRLERYERRAWSRRKRAIAIYTHLTIVHG